MQNLTLHDFTIKAKDPNSITDYIYTNNELRTVKYSEDSITLIKHKYGSRETKDFPVHVEVTDIVKPKFGYLKHEELFYIVDTSKVVLISDDLNLHQIFEFPKKALAFEFAPSEETFAVCYEDGIVSCFNSHFWNGSWECTTSTPTSKRTHVSVGWGSAETQFQGKRKSKASKTKEEVEEPSFKHLDESSAISWRGNGTMFAVNFFDKNSKSRHIKIFTTDCSLIGEFKDMPNLERCIGFRAEGQSIGIINNKSSKEQVLVILGKNGYIHKELPLQFVSHCPQIQWDQNNCCLGISRDISAGPGIVIDLFLQHDYRWVSKYRLKLKNDILKRFEFLDTPERTVKLRIYGVENSYEYTFLIKPNRFVNETENCSITVDIKGNLTESFIYRKDCIPYDPIKLSFENHINDVIFDFKSNKVAFIDCDYSAAVYSYDGINSLLFISKLSSEEICELINYHGYNSEFFRRIENPVCEFDYYKSPYDELQIISRSSKIILEAIYIDPNTKLFLDVDGDLYYNEILFQKNVSSIYIYDNFLIFTEKVSHNISSTFHTLHYVELDKILETINLKKSPYSYRSLEQFAKIINIVPNSAIVILSYPRGNIEHVELRIFKLLLIKKMIEERNFSEAFQELFISSLPLNYFYQLSQQTFLTHTKEIIEQLQDDKINVMIKSTEPVFTISEFETQNILKIEKLLNINDIMNHLRNTILCCEYQKLLPTLCLIKLHNFGEDKVTYDIRNALTEISNVCRGDYQSYNAEAKAALKEIVQITSPEEVYNNSFLINDLQLVQFILENIQIDPQFEQKQIKIYKSMSESLRRATICAKRNEKHNAVKYYLNDYKNGDTNEDDLINYCTKLKALEYLYLEAHKKYETLFDRVSTLYATELEEKQNYLDAGIVHFKNRRWENAFVVFMKGMYVEKALGSVAKLPIDKQKTHLLNLIWLLIDKGLYEEVANIYVRVLNNKSEAIKYYMKGGKFESALTLAQDHQFPEIEMQLKIYFNNLKKKIINLRDVHNDNFQRLKEVREEKLEEKSYLYDCNDHPEEHSSLYQESIISGRTNATSTRHSTRSSRSLKSTKSGNTESSQMSRNERKQAKKYLNAKKGSQYEDIAIMYNLYRNTCNIYKSYAELYANVKVFKMISFKKIYITPLLELEKLQTQVREEAKVIWPEDDYIRTAIDNQETNKVIYDNLLLLDPIYRHEPRAVFNKDGVLKSLADDK